MTLKVLRKSVFNPKIDGPVELRLEADADLVITPNLFQKTSARHYEYVNNGAFMEKRGSLRVIHLGFPQWGDYELQIYEAAAGSSSEPPPRLASFSFSPTRPIPFRYPAVSSIYYERGIRILSPLDNPLKRGSTVNIEVMAPGGDRIAAIVNRRVVRLKKGTGGTYRATVRVEGEELSLHCEEKPNYFTRIALYDVE